MKRQPLSICVACIAVLWAMAGRAQTAPLNSLEAIHALSNEQASQGLPVAFEANVTYYAKGDMDLFVQEDGTAIYAETSKTTNVSAGDRVLVVGHTRASFRPEIKADRVTVVSRGVMPAAIPATFKQLIRAEVDCRRVKVRAVVRGVNSLTNGGVNFVYFELLMEGGSIDAQVVGRGPESFADLVDAEVEVTGTVAGKFDSKLQLAGILLEVPSIGDIKVVKMAAVRPKSLPLTPMDQILAATDVQDRTQRVRVGGTVTYYQPGTALVLQEGSKSLWVTTRFEKPMRLGDRVSVSGFPDVDNGSVILTLGEIEDSGFGAAMMPARVTAKELAGGSRAMELVSIEGRLLMSLRQSAQDEYVVIADGQLFSAIYRHPGRALEIPLAPMKQLPVGSVVRISGICILDRGDQYQGPQAFSILLRSFDDVALVAGPSWLSVRNLVLVVTFLLVALLVMGGRAWATERRLRWKTAELASIERQRGGILEDINSSKPLAEIIDKITRLVSFRLDGAQCWCVLADGTCIGNRTEAGPGLRVIDCRIGPRPEESLGTIHVAVDASVDAERVQEEMLPMASGLAYLAIETKRLHSDLRHRSEFDLLTNIHNRFSLERRLDQLVESAKSGTFRFGLIFIDLDAFKAVNDSYGHDVGDLYLCEAVTRMKSQIRPGDMLARIGGDEFAVLVARVAGIEGVEEVERRLHHCFDAPFEVDGRQIRGSASFGISMCPRDGMSKNSLLKAADLAMYAHKAERGISSQREHQKV